MMSKIRKFKGFVQANENKKLDVNREALNETKFSLDQEMMGQASDTQNPGGVLQDKEQIIDDVFCESKNRRIKNFCRPASMLSRPSVAVSNGKTC